jgi:hypothetical protein
MNDNYDNGISGENEEFISRLAGIIKKERETRAIEAMVGEKINDTDFHSLLTEEDKINRFAGWQKYAAVAAVLVIAGIIGIRLLNENRDITKKNESIANTDNSENVIHDAQPAPPTESDSALALSEPKSPANEEALPGEISKTEVAKPLEEAPIAMVEQPARRERGTGDIMTSSSSVESAKDQTMGGAVIANDMTSRSMQMKNSQTKPEMKPGIPTPKILGNIQDSVSRETSVLADKQKEDIDDEESSRTRSLDMDAIMKKAPKKEINQFLINIGEGSGSADKIKQTVIGVLQSYGYQNLNVSEKEYYIQIKTTPTDGFSSTFGKNISYIIEAKINRNNQGTLTVKLVNLQEDGSTMQNRSIVPIEDLFNKSIKNSLNKALNK